MPSPPVHLLPSLVWPRPHACPSHTPLPAHARPACSSSPARHLALGCAHLSHPLSRAKPHRAAEHCLWSPGGGGCGRAHLCATAPQEGQHVRPPTHPSPGSCPRDQGLGPWGTRGTAMPAHTPALLQGHVDFAALKRVLLASDVSAPGHRQTKDQPPRRALQTPETEHPNTPVP